MFDPLDKETLQFRFKNAFRWPRISTKQGRVQLECVVTHVPPLWGLKNAETASSKHANFLQKKGQSSFINGDDDDKSMKIGWTFFQTCQEP